MTNPLDNDTAATAAADALRDARTRTEPEREVIETITLSNGIVARIRPTPPELIQRAVQRIERPRIPVVPIPDKDVSEPNPLDPDYIQAVAKYEEDTSMAAFHTALMVGAQVEYVPEGVYRPEDPQWIEDIREYADALGFDPPDIREDNQHARRLAWWRYYALTNEEDQVRMTVVLRSSVAVTEEEVAQAVAVFRHRTRWAERLDLLTPKRDQDGDPDQAADRGDGERVRAEGGGEGEPDPVDGLGDSPED